MTFFKVLTCILPRSIQGILSVFHADHEFMDSPVNPQVNDSYRTAFASLGWLVHLSDVNELSVNCSKTMCWVLVAMHHRALLSALTGETVSGISEALGQTKVPKETTVFQVWGHSWCPEPLAKAGAGEMVPLAAGGGCHQVKELQEEVSSCTASEMVKKKKARSSPTPCSYRNQGAQLY